MRAPLTPTLAAPGSACFGGSDGTATFAEHRQEEGQAALGALPPLSDVPGRLRYGYRLWQARRERRGALAAVLRQRVQRAGLSGMAAVAVLNSLYYSGAQGPYKEPIVCLCTHQYSPSCVALGRSGEFS